MPRVIVTTDEIQLPEDAPRLLDEEVQSVHLSTGHASAQLVQRLAWAISDAEAIEALLAGRRKRALPRPLRSRQLAPPTAARRPVGV